MIFLILGGGSASLLTSFANPFLTLSKLSSSLLVYGIECSACMLSYVSRV